ncbi:hypothetical protein SAMN05660816_02580 [Niastella yeongjuensis]|nr:hypothetical protein SAMN05660816_02580 [Niastella yeongjuensis]
MTVKCEQWLSLNKKMMVRFNFRVIKVNKSEQVNHFIVHLLLSVIS